eukprot:gene1318-1335_t
MGTVVRHAQDAIFDQGLRSFFAYRDLGIAEASGGRFRAHVIRAVPGEGPKPAWHTHNLDFQMVFVLRGWAEFEYEDIGVVRIEAGASVYQPPGIRHREIAHSDDLELLEVTSPADFETHAFERLFGFDAVSGRFVNTKSSFLLISFLIVILPWMFWQWRPIRRVAPLAVVQIMAGVVLGPSCFGLLAPEIHGALFSKPVLSLLDGVAGIGVLLYVFATGLHLDTAALRRDTRRLGVLAVGSISAPLLLGLGAGVWMLANVPGALGSSGTQAGFLAAVAICIAVTALPVLAAILQEIGLLHTRLGQQGLAVAAANDAALWLMLAILLPLAASGDDASPLLRLGLSVLWFAALTVVIRPALLRLPLMGDQSVLVIGAALAILSSCFSEALGTGYLIGAFAAGAIMPAAWRAPILARLEMLTATVLLPFFFMSTGLKALIDPGSASFVAVLVLATGATIIGKVAGTALAARATGYGWREALSLGAMMQTKGLMEVVVLAVLNDAGLIGREIFSAMVAMAVICTLITAPLRGQFAGLEHLGHDVAAADELALHFGVLEDVGGGEGHADMGEDLHHAGGEAALREHRVALHVEHDGVGGDLGLDAVVCGHGEGSYSGAETIWCCFTRLMPRKVSLTTVAA